MYKYNFIINLATTLVILILIMYSISLHSIEVIGSAIAKILHNESTENLVGLNTNT